MIKPKKNKIFRIDSKDQRVGIFTKGLSIFTFEQVSKMQSEEYNLLDSLTKSFPGRAERDDWSSQAKDLMNK